MNEYLDWLVKNRYVTKEQASNLKQELLKIDTKNNTKEIAIIMALIRTATVIAMELCDPFTLEICKKAHKDLSKLVDTIGG